MTVVKVAIEIDEAVLREMDLWVAAAEYSSRSEVIQAAITVLKEQRARRGMLLQELAKLDPVEERTLADEVLTAEVMRPAL